jgi:hypothetical protein
MQQYFVHMPPTYAERIERALNENADSGREPGTIRQLSVAAGCSYEHVRKLLGGHPVASKRISEKVSAALGLDAGEMWALAVREKAAQKYGAAASEVLPPPDKRLKALWPRLSRADRDRLVQIAEAYVLAAEAQRTTAPATTARSRTPVKRGSNRKSTTSQDPSK